MNLLNKIWRKLIFWIGDIRLISSFPFITWHIQKHLCSYKEACEGLKHVQKGDIGIHLDKNFLSNFFIPGFMKHAWIHVNNPIQTSRGFDTSNCAIVEAISEGVVKRHALYPMVSDYVIILRPKNVTNMDIMKAVARANSIVGSCYDAKFHFDIEREVKFFDSEEKKAINNNLLKHWDIGFSCSEVISFCYWHIRDKLGIYRKKYHGKKIIVADDFLNSNWEIVWCSPSVTPEVAEQRGLHEEGVERIREYWKNKCKTNEQ